jgi:hypothetical protein
MVYNSSILAKMVLLSGARCFAMFSSLMMLLMMTPAILFLSSKLIGGLHFLSSKNMLTAVAYPHSITDSREFFLVVIDAALEVFCVYCHDSLVAFVWSTQVLETHYPHPFNVMKLPSGFCFKIFTTVLVGHFSVNMMSHIREIRSC